MTNIQFLEEHIEQLKELLFVDDLEPALVESVEKELEYWESISKELNELQAIKNAEPSKVMESLEENLNKAFDYGVQATLDNLLLRGYNIANMLKQEHLGNSLEKDLDGAKNWLTNLKNGTIKATLLKTEKLEKAWEVAKEHLAFEYRGTETYANQTKYLVKIESKDTGATIHIHLDNKEEFGLIKEMLK